MNYGYTYEQWAPMFSVTVGTYRMMLNELKQLRRVVVKNSDKKISIDSRFEVETPYLESAIEKIDASIKDASSIRRSSFNPSRSDNETGCYLVLTFGECFAIYQVLKDMQSKWGMFIFGWAFEIFAKMINRGLYTVYQSLNKKDAQSFIKGQAWYRLESSVCELELVAKGCSPDGYSEEMKKRKPRI